MCIGDPAKSVGKIATVKITAESYYAFTAELHIMLDVTNDAVDSHLARLGGLNMYIAKTYAYDTAKRSYLFEMAVAKVSTVREDLIRI